MNELSEIEKAERDYENGICTICADGDVLMTVEEVNNE